MVWPRRKGEEGVEEGPFFGMETVPWRPQKEEKKGKKGEAATAEEKARPAASLGVLGLPWDHSSSYRRGASKGPRALREATGAKLFNPFTEDGFDLRKAFTVNDLGDVGGQFRRIEDFDKFAAAVAERVQAWGRDGPMLFLGGDHACTYAALRALAKRPAEKEGAAPRWGLVYVDAHPDLYVNYAGSSNSHACGARRLVDEGLVPGERVVQVGVRASTPSQDRYAEQKGVRTLKAAEVAGGGGARAGDAVVKQLLGSVDALYVSLDLDALDPGVAPGVGNPEPGGLTVRDVLDLLRGLAPLPVRALDVMELNPPHDPQRITAFAAAKYLKEGIGVLARAGAKTG